MSEQVPAIDEAFEIEAQALAQIMDELDYFQILKVPQTVSPVALKQSYYRESRTYHPDRFFQTQAGDLKDAVSRIYKRINEAYVCLRDDARRNKYQVDISGPERDKKLRFVEGRGHVRPPPPRVRGSWRRSSPAPQRSSLR